MTQDEWTDRFAAVLLPLGWSPETAASEAAASWEDEWQREVGPEVAASTMLSYLAEEGE